MSHPKSPETNTAPSAPLLNSGNWSRGFLMNSVWMAGISENDPGSAHPWKAWVVSLESGTLLASTDYSALQDALEQLNRLPGKDWTYEPTKSCSGEKCGPENCKGSACKIFKSPNKNSC